MTVAGLPDVVTSYVGRQRETAEVRSLLTSERLVTLTGPGGVGKTRLAAQAVADAAAGFVDGAVFVELAESRDAELLSTLVADRLDLQDRSGRPTVQRVLDQLRDRTMVLVLDNCEHLVTASAEFARSVLDGCPGIVVLATSRQSLGVAGEHVVRVPPLAAPGESASGDLAGFDAVRLFADRASAVLPSFRLTTENLPDVARVCRLLDGLPLAIELAAVRVRPLAPRQLADRLTRHLPVLAAAPDTAPDRQRTLRAAVEWSYELCSPAEQVVWARASVFAGSFDVDAAEEVCAGAGVDRDRMLDVLDELLDKSVLMREDRGDVIRYRMLETLREYGQERLDRDGEAIKVVLAHRDWIDRLTELADTEWAGPHQLEWIARLKNEQANLRAALERSISLSGEAGVALRIACRLDEYWTLRGFNVEARGWLDRALAAAPPDHPDRARALATSGLYALWHSDPDLAATRLVEAERLARPRDVLLKGFITYVRALEAMIRIDGGAGALAARAAGIFREHGVVRRELHPLYIQGVVLAYLGDLDGGRSVLRRMQTLSESCGELYYRGMAAAGLTHIEVQFGDADTATVAARDGLAVAGKIDSRFQLAYRLDGVAWAASRKEDHRRAAILFGAAARIWEAVGASAEVAVALPHIRFIKATKEALGERFDAEFAVGRAMTEQEAVRFGLGEPLSGESRSAELTRREWEVAELVTRGLSNRDIAESLVISQRTADTHVQHILTKLGFRNRAQIAAWFTARR